MPVYVDPSAHPYRGMIMCHMWATTHHELLAMATRIGLSHRWLQTPHNGTARWVHFDICKAKRALAVQFGAIETDKYGPLEHLARMRGDTTMIERIAHLRATAKA